MREKWEPVLWDLDAADMTWLQAAAGLVALASMWLLAPLAMWWWFS